MEERVREREDSNWIGTLVVANVEITNLESPTGNNKYLLHAELIAPFKFTKIGDSLPISYLKFSQAI